MAKRLSSLFLLLLVCALSCMLPVRYGLKQAAKLAMQHRMERESEVHEKSILIAAPSLAAAEWEGPNEFRLDGQLYDVASIVYVDGQKYYRCLSDELELRMEHGADNLAAGLFDHHTDNKDGKVVKSLIDWLQDLYFYPASPASNVSIAVVRNHYFAAPIHFLKDPFPDNRIMPPEA